MKIYQFILLSALISIVACKSKEEKKEESQTEDEDPEVTFTCSRQSFRTWHAFVWAETIRPPPRGPWCYLTTTVCILVLLNSRSCPLCLEIGRPVIPAGLNHLLPIRRERPLFQGDTRCDLITCRECSVWHYWCVFS